MRASVTLLFVAALAAALAGGCTGGQYINGYSTYTGGNARQGKALIVAYGCGSCHTIPGVPNAHGLVGPPLYFWARRTYIAGELPNTPANLVRWIHSPSSVEPNTAMPTLGVSDQDARNMAAYLYTIH
jgi:cytochrome c